MTLRQATAADAAPIAALLVCSRRTLQPYAPGVHAEADVQAWVRETLLPAGGVIVACADASVVGVLAALREPQLSWITQLYLAPTHIRLGIGSWLLAHALATLPTPVRLYTFQANARARAFYEHHGFRAIAFGDGSDNEDRCPDVLYELAAAPTRPA